jgi:hypothetical protein
MDRPAAYRTRLAIAAAGMAISLFPSPSNGDSKHLPWKEPLPGTPAVLGDDGGGVDTATVCDTPEKFNQWLDTGSGVAGCHSLPHGLPIILGSMLDSAQPDAIVNSYPLVKIIIPSRHNYAGYVQLFGQTHPNIPKETVVHYRREGNATLRLAPSRDSNLDAGPDLGEAVTATILQYDAASDGMDLYVEINDGPFAGRKGWMLSLGAESEDGEPADMFYEPMMSR